MCGIVGYIGHQKASPILINGLKALEYRGYDSAGIAVLEENKIIIAKEKGRVKNLENKKVIQNINSTIGIAHTRWATHGIPSEENAHPHTDSEKLFAVVHNGIIENYLELKNFLLKKGYTFTSETDTEVIPNLINYYYKKENDGLKALKCALKDLKGSYAILVLSPLFKGIYVAKMGSPLVIGEGSSENFIASDIPAVLNYTRDFYFLDDGDLAYICDDTITFYNKDLEVIKHEKKTIDWDINAADKNGYEDYMLKEIFEQPRAISDTIAGRIISDTEEINFLDLKITIDDLKDINKIYLIACGTAMHAGKVGKNIIEELTNIVTIVDVASEFRYNTPIIDSHTLCIFISQSGETADTIAALKLAKAKGARTMAITNVIGSSITREADDTIYTHAGPEIAVASTKAYVSQVVVLALLGMHFAELLDTKNKKIKELKKDILSIPEKLNLILKDAKEYQNLAKNMKDTQDCFYIGRGNDYNTAMEGSLKLKEISYIHSEAYPAGELKHGPIALIEKDSFVLGIITNNTIAEKTFSNLEEVITRGAKVILITNCDIDNKKMAILKIPDINTLLSPILAIVPLQLIAYYIAKEKNLDVDKPRNLAKSVTVE